MSYQVLARKWRPTSFKQMVGQEHVLKALIHSLDSQRLHHAYLFTGTRGVGKTTLGRILARCLNCDTGISSEPCGKCSTCVEISEGRFVDLIEIDAASRTKVEDMRELLENVQYAPTRARFKVYLIDEVHMLTNQSFNALLKTLEEPPEHVKFLFATTDPQKLPVTILSRCLQFNLKNMAAEKIVGHLGYVLNQEKIGHTQAALWLLARAAEGSMRDALSLTDQAISFCNSELNESLVSEMLGTVDHGQTLRLIEALASLNARVVLNDISVIAQYSPDYKELLANIIDVLHRIALEQMVPGITENHLGDQEEIVRLAQQLLVEDVQLWYQIALLGRKDLDLCPDMKTGFEMVMLRMLAFKPNLKNADELGDRPLLKTEEAQKKNPEALKPYEPQSKRDIPVSNTARPLDVIQSPETHNTETLIAVSSAPEPVPLTPSNAETLKPAEGEVGLTPEPAHEVPSSRQFGPSEGGFDSRSLNSHEKGEERAESKESFLWGEDYRSIGLAGMTLNLASNCAWIEKAGLIELQVSPASARLLTDTHRKHIREAILNHPTFKDKGLEVQFRECEPEGETPAQRRERLREERRLKAVEVIRNDPIVQSLLQVFDGRLVESTIQPVD